jgi:hypothetical protein
LRVETGSQAAAGFENSKEEFSMKNEHVFSKAIARWFPVRPPARFRCARTSFSRMPRHAGMLASLAALTLVTTPTRAQSSPTTITVDASIFRGPNSIADSGRGPRPLAAVADASGIVSRFISNEVIFADSEQKLPAFLAKYGGKEIAALGGSLYATGKAVAPVKGHVIRLDASSVSLQNLANDATKMGMKGSNRFSSTLGAQLAALVASEAANGLKLSLNFVSDGHDFPTGSTEQADQNGVSNAFKWPEFDSKAWEFVAANGFSRRVKIAIIDGGFWLNANGVPCDLVVPDATCGLGSVSKGVSDLPGLPVQFNPIGNGSPFAGGANPNTCTNGAPCPWHGNQVASVALALLNNNAGAAGTGGQVANPILLKFDGSDDTAVAAVLDAMGDGADIINMSFGGACNDWCRAGHYLSVVDSIMDSALDSGILMVASAGNDSADALDQHEWPCQYSSGNGNGVYCVGALNPVTDGFGYFVNNDGTAAPYSNYGTTVNIWAPTNIHVMPDGGSNGKLPPFNGTSASAPYVSGVAAMVKAINPSLDANAIKNIIGNGPYTVGTSTYGFPYTDPKVDLVIRPYPAVVAAAGGYHLKPELHITAPVDGATILVSSYVSVTFTALAADVNDGQWPLVQGYKSAGPTPVTWSSDVDGPFPVSGTNVSFDFTNSPEGLRHVTASVTNSAGLTTSVTIAVTIKFNHVTPSPLITWPPPNTSVAPGAYTVTGYAKSTDPGVLGNFDCSRLMWNGSVPAVPLPNSNGQCEARLTFAAGTQQITLSATDKFGDTGKTTVSLNVAPQAGLSVQILNPLNGSYDIVVINSSSALGLSGNAAPLIGGVVNYSWYWYLTSAGPAAKKLIATGPNGTWNAQASGICHGNGTWNVTIELDVVDSVPGVIGGGKGSHPPITLSGSATSNIQVVCETLN